MPTLNLDNVRDISVYSVQEILAGLLWQGRFNNFDGSVVAQDLAQMPHLWSSFLFTLPIYTPDPAGLGIRYSIDILQAMANDLYGVKVDRFNNFHSYHINTLYLLTQRDEGVISQLLDLGQKWQADTIEVIDGRDMGRMFEPQLQKRIRKKLAGSLSVESEASYCDAAIVSFWWDTT